MNTVVVDVPEMTIQQFAEKHDLVMEIRERERPSDSTMRYYAHFRKAETKVGEHMLCGEHGNGPSKAYAVAQYAQAISLKTLVIDAMGYNRREIRVPRLTSDKKWKPT